MTTQLPCVRGPDASEVLGSAPANRHYWVLDSGELLDRGVVEPLSVASVAESAEAVIEDLEVSHAVAPALLEEVWAADRDVRNALAGAGTDNQPISVDEYAKAVLYNGLGHYQAARVAAQRACERSDFALLDGALAELIEASMRSGNRGCAVGALQTLETRAQIAGSAWAIGVAACGRALLGDGQLAEDCYLEAIERLGQTRAKVTLARARLLYGEWLRRRGRRVDARKHLALAHHAFAEARLSGFAERARRELRATGRTVRTRTSDTRLDLTPQEAQTAELAAGGWTNPEIGERLYISPRTVEWHLRKVFTKLGISSRKELKTHLPQVTHVAVSA